MQDDKKELHDSDEFQVILQNYKRKGMNHGRAMMIAESEFEEILLKDDTEKSKKRSKKNASK